MQLPPRRRWLALAAAVIAVIATIVGIQFSAAAPSAHNATGAISYSVLSGGRLAVAGWASDPDTTKPIYVDFYLNGRGVAHQVADKPSTSGHNGHGFWLVVPARQGANTLCVYAINTGPGAPSTTLFCRTVTVNSNPVGAVTSLGQASGGKIAIAGWATDPDTPAAIAVHIYLNGVGVAVAANGAAAGHPGHGFATTLTARQGANQICAYAINAGAGTGNPTLLCLSITVNSNPIGAVTSLGQAPGGKIAIAGWATDPDTASPIAVHVYVNGVGTALNANGPATGHTGHGFTATLPALQGANSVCAYAINVGAGTTNPTLKCQTVTTNYSPTGQLTSLTAINAGGKVTVTGWATDPDTSAPIYVDTYLNGVGVRQLASLAAAGHPGHGFAGTYPARQGANTLCAYGINVSAGGNAVLGCSNVTVNSSPRGGMDSAVRAGTTGLTIKGWAADPDTSAPLTVKILIDGAVAGQTVANLARTDMAGKLAGVGNNHGFAVTVPVNANEHRVCLYAVNIGAGSDQSPQCTIVWALHPGVPSAPRTVAASVVFGGATVTWSAPATDGGAPLTRYTVKSVPAAPITVSISGQTASVNGLAANTRYSFQVTATNPIGTSAAGTSNAVTTPQAPPPQTTPAPISTSRYVRDITGAASDVAGMRADGAADAAANPTGHAYLMLLDIGGQGTYGGQNGVVLSATTRFVTETQLVTAVKAYIDGYASRQKPSAPAVIAIGTNNDMDVSATTGARWARNVVSPIASYAARYAGIQIAGANDIEPGFSANAAQSRAWVSGYLGATGSPFVFNGSADGCNWTVVNGNCNNGWKAADLQWLASGAAPTRTVNLPQIYNTTMAQQWKYISLTGVVGGKPRINFGGPLTEWTACAQAGSCGSLTGNAAWGAVWSAIRSDARISQGSLPYATDLRIN